MARLSITIASDNDALVDPENDDLEINYILSNLRSRIYDTDTSVPADGKVLDSNGNAVGTWEWIPGETES